MKLTLTDKFLITVFEAIEGIQELQDWFPRSMKEAVWPEYRWVRVQYERKLRRKNFYQLLNYLKKKGYIKIKELQAKKAILLTKKGLNKVFLAKLKKVEEETKNFKLYKRKDKKYLMVVFDIPEEKRKLRDFLRDCLKNLGFVLFQKSIWVSPYDVREKLETIIVKSQLEKYVRIFLIEEIKI